MKNRLLSRRGIWLLMLLTSVSLQAGVKINGVGAEYATIQAAVNAAASGQRLCITTGRYVEAVTITGKALALEGGYYSDYASRTNIPAATIVGGDTGPLASVFRVADTARVSFDTLDIMGGTNWSGGALLAAQPGGAAYYMAHLENVVVVQNQAGTNGSAVNLSSAAGYSAVLEMQECTIADNGYNGVDTHSGGDLPVLQNCIIWGHSLSQMVGNATIQRSAVQGGYPGFMNITNNPDFADPGALFYALRDESPCIDRGADIYSITNDCIGNPRPYGGGWDMGAYEFVPEPGALLLALLAIYNVRLAIGRRKK